LIKTVLISGAGIADPTLACWLSRWGFEATLVERAPAFRSHEPREAKVAAQGSRG
jgi:2-polyprenyl-6-methoxyphenol hydroxylase-like FAD-dependent oxidoreductase